MFPIEYPQYTTVTCLEWKTVLENDREKKIVIQSMRFLVAHGRVQIFGFVLMSNHFHLIWQMAAEYRQQDQQRDFLKYTAQQILKNFRNENSSWLKELLVSTADRKYQVWERNPLSIPLWSAGVIEQKLEYIHMNPVRAGLCEYPEDYKYSSAKFYLKNESEWDFITHIDG